MANKEDPEEVNDSEGKTDKPNGCPDNQKLKIFKALIIGAIFGSLAMYAILTKACDKVLTGFL